MHVPCSNFECKQQGIFRGSVWEKGVPPLAVCFPSRFLRQFHHHHHHQTSLHSSTYTQTPPFSLSCEYCRAAVFTPLLAPLFPFFCANDVDDERLLRSYLAKSSVEQIGHCIMKGILHHQLCLRKNISHALERSDTTSLQSLLCINNA